jgi:hypothetical protein
MKLKGINPFEQHVEQIVLVAVSGIFLVVVAAQFLVEPNRVKVGGGQPVPPGKAFADSEVRANQLKGKLTASGTPEDVTIPEVRLADDFKGRLTQPVVSQSRLEASLGRSMQLREVEGAHTFGPDQAVAVAAVPAPAQPVARAFRNTIDPTEPLNNPGLAALLPKQQPMDKAAVSVESTFDGRALRQAFAAAGPEAKAMPIQWWDNRTAVLGVRLEREELVDGETWSNSAEIPPPPGRLDGLERTKPLTTTAEMEDLVAELRSAEDDVLRAPYYRTIAGPAWAAPSEQPAAAATTPREITQLVAEVKRYRNQLEALNRQLQDVNQAPSRTAPGGGGGGGKGGAGRGGGSGGGQVSDPKESERRRLQGQIDNIQKRLDADIAKLKDKGFDENGQSLKNDQPPPVDPAQQPGGPRSLLDQPSLRIWAHDLTAEPGKTYRYRVKLAVNNPVFGRAAALPEKQKDLAKQPALWSQPSEWTAPVTVPADHYYFITSASEANPVTTSSARATAEMYQFFYGYYRKGVVSMEPGDPMIARVSLPAGEKLPIYDLTKPMADANNPGQPPAPQGEAPLPPPPARGGGKGGALSGGPGAAPQGPGGAGQPQPQPPKVELPPNASKWDTPIVAAEDVFFLDVQNVPTPSGPQLLAVLRDNQGQLVTRSPDEAADVYKAVAASAKEGENQGQPVLPEPEKPRPGPMNPPPGRAPAPPPPPSGGGGGGAGG